MKKLIKFSLLGAFAISSVACHTSYDAYGNPRQAVDPGVAVAGVAAAGVLGYAIARERDDDDRHGYHHRPRHHHYRNPYYRY
jgi:hypothetical protein